LKWNIKINGPDESPKEATPLPRNEQHHFDNTRIPGYIKLPIEWDDQKPVIRWKNEWCLEGH
jgi:hypothetical protein